jgi:hypothetical protein
LIKNGKILEENKDIGNTNKNKKDKYNKNSWVEPDSKKDFKHDQKTKLNNIGFDSFVKNDQMINFENSLPKKYGRKDDRSLDFKTSEDSCITEHT